MPIEILKLDGSVGNLDPALLNDHRTIVLEAEDLYPGIAGWYNLKARQGIEKGERIGYLVKKDGMPVGAAIARHGTDAKICTVRIRDEAMHEGIGKILFLLLAMNLRNETKRVHFTIPEHLWLSYESFFNGMGFTSKGYADVQYRLWDNEIIAEADYLKFQSCVFNEFLPKYAGLLAQMNGEKVDIILSLKPEYANRIINRTKVMELRRKFSMKWIGSWVMIYSSKPIQAFVGAARIKDIIKDTPISLWQDWREAIDCREEEFYEYVNGTNEVYGIIFDEVKPIEPIPKSQLQHLLKTDLVPPQSYCNVENSPIWRSAVGISHLLQKHI